VFAATTDAAANISKCTNDMRDAEEIEEPVRCFCHTLQLAVKTALEKSAGIDPAVTAAKSIVRYFKSSNIAAEALRAAQVRGKEALVDRVEEAIVEEHASEYTVRPLKLIQDVCTRWSSTHMMCERLVRLKPFVRAEPNPVIDLTATELQQLAELVQILQPCPEAIKLMEGKRYPTLPM